MTPRKAIFGYLLCVGMFLCGIFSMLSNRSGKFNEFNDAANAGKAIALNSGFAADSLFKVLHEGNYIIDEKDARLAANWIHAKIDTLGSVANLGSLLKDNFKIPAQYALKNGGSETKLRVETDYFLLGQDVDYHKNANTISSSTFGENTNDNALISVKVTSKEPGRSLAGIPIRLRKHYKKTEIVKSTLQDTVFSEEIVDETIAWVKTDNDGCAKFYVPKGRYYSVVPVNRGYQYGKAKGTTSSELNDELKLRFTEKVHTLTPISRSVFSEIKADNAVTARTPDDFKNEVFFGCLIYILAWALALLYILYTDYRLKTSSDYLTVIILMALTAIGMFAWFSITDPLSDILHGRSMAMYLGIGIVAFAVLYSINWTKFYHGQSLCQPKNKYSWILNISQHKGWIFLGAALALFTMLALFGSGPEGSAAKVNLGPLQPSEICKFLILAFIAAYFAENYSLIQKFSEKATAVTVKRKLTIMSVIVAAMALLMLVYFYLSDGGPAIVLLFTFILLYSVIRQDIGKMLLGVLTFGAALIAAWIFTQSMLVLALTAVAWYVGWSIYCYKQHTIYESAIFMNLIPLLFILMNAFLGGNEGARMSNRVGMAWSGVWDNTVPGGDQIAQGLWGVASGGMTGMGLGDGSPASIPACHTDMAFLSIGEMLGFIGLLLVVLCMFALIHRTLLIGRKAGNPFVMFFVMGLGIITGVQFLVIVFGSLGFFPLTGINVPFLSQGGVSLVMMLAVYGIALSASRLKTTDAQKENARKFQGAVAAGALIFMAGAVVIIATLANYQFFSKSDTLIRPAFITTTEGARIVEYNPRINQILRRLDSGNIYDRNGLILATSTCDSIIAQKNRLKNAGISEKELREVLAKTQRRYYPFGNHTLFMIGDANTRKVYSYYDSNPIGYLAEYRHLSELKGIDVPTDSVITLTAEDYKPHRFLPGAPQGFKASVKDYSNLLPFLEHGVYDNPFIESHNAARSDHDMTLTLDAALQVRLQHSLKEHIGKYVQPRFKKYMRASIVILDCANGDLLASANYPLPEQDSITMLIDQKHVSDVPFEDIKGHDAITERDLGLTFQSVPGSTAKIMSAISALMKFGVNAANKSFKLNKEDCIGHDGIGRKNMKQAIVSSHNGYFIKLIHTESTYAELDSLYRTVGIRLSHDNGTTQTPYYFDIKNISSNNSYSDLLYNIEDLALTEFNKPNKQINYWAMATAWGQGPLRATPLNMARVASIVANNGIFVPTRYVLSKGAEDMSINEARHIITHEAADSLRNFMQAESRKAGYSFPASVGGKTGTADRDAHKLGKSTINDAWYICFISSEKTKSPLAIAIRIERCGYKSDKAKKFVEKQIIPTLKSLGY